MTLAGDPFLPDFPLDEAIRAAQRAPSPAAFRASDLHRRHGRALDAWLSAVRSGVPPDGGAPAPAREPSRLRLVHWNIQQGKAWEKLLAAIESEPLLRDADLWTLNEVDIGTARAGNRDVVRELAARLRLHWAYAANFLELTKGPGADARVPGENRLGLHGSALLSRWPLASPGAAALPDCFDYFHFPEEKRYGCRRVLWAVVAHPLGSFLLATTHLEVRNTPACRARQMRAALRALPAGPGWFTGDWNTNTFRRRGLIHRAAEFVRLQRTPAAEIDRQLREPWDREPLLGLVEAHGFDLRSWNDLEPTVRQVLAGVEEVGRLPGWIADSLRRRFRLNERVLRMRLDWIGARGPWRAPSTDPRSWTLTAAGPEGFGASDHAPIGIEALHPGFTLRGSLP